jgi:Domain of unknown function (DUF932)
MENAIMSIYTATARFDTGRPLSEAELRKLAPSIFATQAHESRSERFQPICTYDVVRALENEGFGVVGAQQAITRVEGKAPYTKHILRIRSFKEDRQYQVGDSVFEMKLKNANDGTSPYDLMGALWRIKCLNSLVAMSQEIETVKIRHTGRDIVDRVIEGTYSVLDHADAVLAAPQDWSQIELGRDARHALAKAAHVVRFADAEGNVNTPIEPEQLLTRRRAADTGNDLWTVYNVIQENVIRGGLVNYGRNNEGRLRRTTTRAIKGIDQDIRVNKALFVLGQEMASILKQAA